MKIITHLFLLLISFFSTTVIGAEDPALARLQALLAKTETLQARFQQENQNRFQKTSEVHQGEVYIAKPSRFRWVVEKPDNQLIVADGKNLWVYDKDLAQVTVQALSAQISEVPLLLLSGDQQVLTKSYLVMSHGSHEDNEWFELQSKEDSNLIRQIRLNFFHGVIDNLSIQDMGGTTTQLQFNQVKHNLVLSQALFHFQPPKGVDVVGKVVQ